MKEKEFERFLVADQGIESKDKAVRSRVSKARKVENDLNIKLDEVVNNDEAMYRTLINIKDEMKDSNGAYQNAVRKYYIFVNHKEFPSLLRYERTK